LFLPRDVLVRSNPWFFISSTEPCQSVLCNNIYLYILSFTFPPPIPPPPVKVYTLGLAGLGFLSPIFHRLLRLFFSSMDPRFAQKLLNLVLPWFFFQLRGNLRIPSDPFFFFPLIFPTVPLPTRSNCTLLGHVALFPFLFLVPFPTQ